ncbi:high affinity immunoglobulin gamma Fc receptor I-like [Leuresthes tenuis]|uniref:high affinity immunoglobulin gamma Fc receptor I-like n=1 Tax=Leuresthes tenuis TaxID=355514 RepID=UPI003B51489F
MTAMLPPHMLQHGQSSASRHDEDSSACSLVVELLPDVCQSWLSQCGVGWGTQTSSTCSVKSLKPDDSGVYWCESKHRDSSNAINITVTERQQHSVILQSPALPVMEGDDVTLSCQIKNGTKTTSSNLPAAFYKDGSSIGTEPTGHMTLHHVTRSDEGLYMCNISIHKKSPPSWLLIRDDSKPPFLTVSPDSTQLFEYDKLSLSCSNNSSSHGWRIQRFLLHNGILSNCGKGLGIQNSAECTIEIAKKQDSGIYWCESPAKQRSNSVNISITDNPVILQSPALPVMEGDDVTLSCRSKTTSSNLPAAFYKDGSSIRTEPTGHMTLHHVTRSDEGLYMCNISIHKKSPPSWLLIRALKVSEPTPTALDVARHILVCAPYLISTVLVVSLYRHRPTGRKPPVSMTTSPQNEEDEGLDYDDAVAHITTEHHF